MLATTPQTSTHPRATGKRHHPLPVAAALGLLYHLPTLSFSARPNLQTMGSAHRLIELGAPWPQAESAQKQRDKARVSNANLWLLAPVAIMSHKPDKQPSSEENKGPGHLIWLFIKSGKDTICWINGISTTLERPGFSNRTAQDRAAASNHSSEVRAARRLPCSTKLHFRLPHGSSAERAWSGELKNPKLWQGKAKKHSPPWRTRSIWRIPHTRPITVIKL